MLGWLDPDQLFGNLLTPLVTLAVALILFEGGLSLTRAELATGGRVVALLVTVGVGDHLRLRADARPHRPRPARRREHGAGRRVVVTGPTVVGPMLAMVRPSGPVGPVLKAEGILIDPLGAVLAALVFEAAFATDDSQPRDRCDRRPRRLRRRAGWPSAWPGRSWRSSCSGGTSSPTP